MTSLDIIAGDKQLIPYRKELNSITGGVTSTILLQQLIYWWKKAGNKPFFKFMSPCGHDKYKAGDSWTEELGFSVKEFRTALRRLEDAGLVSKRTRADRVTWYTLNSELVEEQIKGQYVNAERAVPLNAERAVPLNAERAVHTTNSRLPETTTDIPPNPQGGSADAQDSGQKQEKQIAKSQGQQKIIELYNEICGERLPRVIALNSKRKSAIERACQLKLANGNKPFADYNEDPWRRYFELILENPWNLGENPSGWKADFDYSVRETTILKTLERAYG